MVRQNRTTTHNVSIKQGYGAPNWISLCLGLPFNPSPARGTESQKIWQDVECGVELLRVPEEGPAAKMGNPLLGLKGKGHPGRPLLRNTQMFKKGVSSSPSMRMMDVFPCHKVKRVLIVRPEAICCFHRVSGRHALTAPVGCFAMVGFSPNTCQTRIVILSFYPVDCRFGLSCVDVRLECSVNRPKEPQL